MISCFQYIWNRVCMQTIRQKFYPKHSLLLTTRDWTGLKCSKSTKRSSKWSRNPHKLANSSKTENLLPNVYPSNNDMLMTLDFLSMSVLLIKYFYHLLLLPYFVTVYSFFKFSYLFESDSTCLTSAVQTDNYIPDKAIPYSMTPNYQEILTYDFWEKELN